jgi:long-chain acyl-CoA synthetase
MYSGQWVQSKAETPAIIMASSGEAISFGEHERRSNRLAHYLRGQGLARLDHYSVFMENHVRYTECCAAGERAGALLHLH